eukprot:m.93163 g.93163  ORF g.93163 m.93163 type:complete len:190 (-) comp20277_c0_seq2:2407-2976(-)
MVSSRGWLLAVCTVVGVAGHTSRLPGRFEKTDRTVLAAASTCETAFSLDGMAYNLSDLQVDVGGYIAINNLDNFSYCINICKAVTSERNCVCYGCGGQQYPAAEILHETTGETCKAYLGELEKAQWTTLPAPAKGLRLTYGGGEGGKSAVFDMQCDPTDPGINDGPTFVGTKDELVYRFAWNTSYACGK